MYFRYNFEYILQAYFVLYTYHILYTRFKKILCKGNPYKCIEKIKIHQFIRVF